MFCDVKYYFKNHEQVRELVSYIQDLSNIQLFQKTQDSTLLWSHFHFS